VIVNRSSILLFFGSSSRTSVGLCLIAVFYCAIQLCHPYVRPRNDQLQLTVQTELFLLLLAAHVLEANTDDPDLMDLVLSVLLLIVSFGTVLLFIYHGVLHLRQQYWTAMRKKTMQESASLIRAEAGSTLEMSTSSA
jgi:hypothetical protein